jgi:hypothetical protein
LNAIVNVLNKASGDQFSPFRDLFLKTVEEDSKNGDTVKNWYEIRSFALKCATDKEFVASEELSSRAKSLFDRSQEISQSKNWQVVQFILARNDRKNTSNSGISK